MRSFSVRLPRTTSTWPEHHWSRAYFRIVAQNSKVSDWPALRPAFICWWPILRISATASGPRTAWWKNGSMSKMNIENPEFMYDSEDPDGFRAGMLRFGPQVGATRTGTSV